MRRPMTAIVLATLQFLVAGALCVVRLGDGTLDGELSVGDVAAAVGIAVAGAIVVGATWSGHRLGWYFDLLLGVALVVYGAVLLALDSEPALAVLVAGLVWLVLLALPPSRAYYLRTTD